MSFFQENWHHFLPFSFRYPECKTIPDIHYAILIIQNTLLPVNLKIQYTPFILWPVIMQFRIATIRIWLETIQSLISTNIIIICQNKINAKLAYCSHDYDYWIVSIVTAGQISWISIFPLVFHKLNLLATLHVCTCKHLTICKHSASTVTVECAIILKTGFFSISQKVIVNTTYKVYTWQQQLSENGRLF